MEKEYVIFAGSAPNDALETFNSYDEAIERVSELIESFKFRVRHVGEYKFEERVEKVDATWKIVVTYSGFSAFWEIRENKVE